MTNQEFSTQVCTTTCTITPGSPAEYEYVEVKPAKEETVKLTMSRETAQTLLTVARRIAGPPNGPRGNMDRIAEALQEAGIESLIPRDDDGSDDDGSGLVSTLYHSIRFTR